uniref:Uncharacterized protein n=1 Tax=viral metagenome TaxID=1070528 RepID=A0A6C0BHF8_9ZZZZ
MDEKIKLFEEYKTLINFPGFIIDLEKTSKEALQVLVNRKKIKLGIAVLPPAPPAPKPKHFEFAPEAFVQRFDPENASRFNSQNRSGGALNAGKQVITRDNGGSKPREHSLYEKIKLGALEPKNDLSNRRKEELNLLRTAGVKFLIAGIEGARKYLEVEVPKAIAAGKINLKENETAESIINNLLEEVKIDAESKTLEQEKVEKGSENILKGGLTKFPKWQRKSKFNELFTKKFGHAPTNHVVSGIINQHNVHAGSSGRKTRKNRH